MSEHKNSTMGWLTKVINGVTPVGMLAAVCFLVLTYAKFCTLAKSYDSHCAEQTEAFKAQTERDNAQDREQLTVRDKQTERDRVQDAEFQMIHPILVELKVNTENMKTDITDIKEMLERHVIP